MGLRQLYETNNMISQDDFSLFDPQKMGASVLPDKPSNYIIVLRNTSSLPIKVQISAQFENLGELVKNTIFVA